MTQRCNPTNSSYRGELYRRIRAAQGYGRPLDRGLRRSLEHSLGADLAAVRLHTGPDAIAITRLLKTAAATCGADIFVAAGQYRPATYTGLWLLGHEAAHVVQQAQRSSLATGESGLDVGCAASGEELVAELVAAQVIAGVACSDHGLNPARANRSDNLFVQRFNSWEHFMLGAAPTATLVGIASLRPGWEHLAQSWRDLAALWKDNPDRVSEAQIHAIIPDLSTLRLEKSGCLVTFGELNALGDYVADAAAVNDLPYDIILPLLQQVRQRCYHRLGEMLGDHSEYHFAAAVSKDPGSHELGALEELDALERFTASLGVNHSKGMLARNACHFVPFSWYRWQTGHRAAEVLATAAKQTTDISQQASLTQRAWVSESYACHFLEDSFVAGHQINKILIMQWFIDWAAERQFIVVPHRAGAERVTIANQPALWGRPLYQRGYPGAATDPQTAQEQPAYALRRDTSAVAAYGTTSQDQAYQEYLSFLASAVIQLSSNQIHNYLNVHALWIATESDPTPLQIWGDDTLLRGVEHVARVSGLVHASQQVIRDLLTIGQSSTTAQMLLDQLPSKIVLNPADAASAVSVANWHDARLQAFCDSIFDRSTNWLADVFSRLNPSMGLVSIDQVVLLLQPQLAYLR